MHRCSSYLVPATGIMYSARGFLLKTLLFVCLYSQLDASIDAKYNKYSILTLADASAQSADGADTGMALSFFHKLGDLSKSNISDCNGNVTKAKGILTNIDQYGKYTPLVFNTLKRIENADCKVETVNGILNGAKKEGYKIYSDRKSFDNCKKDIETAAAFSPIPDPPTYKVYLCMYKAAGRMDIGLLKELIAYGLSQFKDKTGVNADALNKEFNVFKSDGTNTDAIKKAADDAKKTVDPNGDPFKDISDLTKAAKAAGTLSTQNASDIVNAIVAALAKDDPKKLKAALDEAKANLKLVTGPDLKTVLDAIEKAYTAATDVNAKDALLKDQQELQAKEDAEKGAAALAILLKTIGDTGVFTYPTAIDMFTDLVSIADGGNTIMFSDSLDDAIKTMADKDTYAAKEIKPYLDQLKKLGNNNLSIQTETQKYLDILEMEQNSLMMAIIELYTSLSNEVSVSFARQWADLLNEAAGNLVTLDSAN